ncbi:hypothetical protein N431DRAFT_79056 [Stipitochalara longipes BDJ]|nr:hypothetical protein N431DRAFT_79056 [Stipitochalara longipes BDJ]
MHLRREVRLFVRMKMSWLAHRLLQGWQGRHTSTTPHQNSRTGAEKTASRETSSINRPENSTRYEA